MQQKERNVQESGTNPNDWFHKATEKQAEEKTAWELRNEWRKAYNTHRRIRAHIAKICDGRHTMLADNGVRILQEEATRLLQEIKAIEEHFKHKRWAL